MCYMFEGGSEKRNTSYIISCGVCCWKEGNVCRAGRTGERETKDEWRENPDGGRQKELWWREKRMDGSDKQTTARYSDSD